MTGPSGQDLLLVDDLVLLLMDDDGASVQSAGTLHHTATRAQELERGQWGAAAVDTGVARTAAGIAASSAAAAISVSTATR
ncbi:protein of unknown function [Modestobacter italicus]|uniref:Uncharacterized protein n=1 Tax=Modestobacter italicus (strain DSM 44449 / CECT 9708 / BC 501) TaxID=2732864 RepID=I4EVJ5_MODI5|nr:hypothetical protein [Modestobacter marinus]CCH87408.1 protein of unknown function [Modestobacter marinus]